MGKITDTGRMVKDCESAVNVEVELDELPKKTLIIHVPMVLQALILPVIGPDTMSRLTVG